MLNGFKPRLYQETILATASTKNTLVVLPTGMGKCLAGDEPVLLEDGGIVRIGDLVEQELKNRTLLINTPSHVATVAVQPRRVLALDNDMKLRPVNIVGYHKINTDRLVRVKSESGASVSATPEHPFLVWRREGPCWVSADSLVVGDRIACPKRIVVSSRSRKIDVLKVFACTSRTRRLRASVDGRDATLEDACKQGKPALVWFEGPKTHPAPIKLMHEVSEDFLYWLGLTFAKGRISGGVRFYNDDDVLLEQYEEISQKVFGIRPEIIDGGLLLRSTALVHFLKWWGLKPCQNSGGWRVPEMIMTLDDACVMSFLRGWFDVDGRVCSRSAVVELATASQDAATSLSYLLLRFGIRARVRAKQQHLNLRVKKKQACWCVRIESREALAVFASKIGFGQECKNRLLQKHVPLFEGSNTNHDSVPASGELLRKAIEGLAKGMQVQTTSSGLCLLAEQGNVFENRLVAAFKAICDAPVIWERIVSVRKEKTNAWVYDISLEDCFNFVAGKNGGMIAHNTAIAFMLAAQRLQNYPQSKILVLAPTKPLAEQHFQTFKQHLQLAEDRFVILTGEIPPARRHELWKNASVIFATPQGIENDVLGGNISLDDVSLVVFDEAHRAVGDYSYVFLAKQYVGRARFPRILGLTASPGSDVLKIEEVCKNLFIEGVEIRTDRDADVSPYVQDTEVKVVKVPLPVEFLDVRKSLDLCIKSKFALLRELGFKRPVDYYSKKELLALQAELHARLAGGERGFETMRALSVAAEAMKVQHALELLESQGATPLNKYLDKLVSEAATSKVRAVKNLVADANFKSAVVKVQKLLEQGIEHPKLAVARGIVAREIRENSKSKVLLFTQFRDTAVKIKEELEKASGVVPAIFVGQAKKGETGLSQKEQAELIEQFKDGLYNVLICTSVAEEGLDIPSVDLVVFYEPIPSAIRTIQRRGRTGRQDKGRVVVLVAQNTRDEGYRWSAYHKEKKMYRILDDLRSSLHKKFAHSAQQPSLQSFSSQERPVLVFADYREKGTGVLKELAGMGVSLKLKMLDVADYVLSPRCAVELKTVEDFAQSLIDGRLLEQLKQLKKHYERPLIIVEGSQDLFSVRNIHPNAIRGMLATVAVSYGIPIIYTKNAKDTAAQLVVVAKREQELNKETFQPHAEKQARTVREHQEYLVSSLPGVGLQLAKDLLAHFKSVKNIVNASEEELKKVEGVGDRKARMIKDVIDNEYQEKGF